MTHIIVVAPNIGHYKCKTVHKDLQKCKTVQKDLHNLADQSWTMYKKLHIILEQKFAHICLQKNSLHTSECIQQNLTLLCTYPGASTNQ